MSTTARTSLDMRGKTITTFIAYETLKQLGDLADGESLELLTDAGEEITTTSVPGAVLGGKSLRRPGTTMAASSTSSPNSRCAPPASATPHSFRRRLEELLSPLAFALAAALEGSDVSLYFHKAGSTASWPKASPSTCTGRVGRSAGSPGPGSPGPGTSRRRRSSASYRRLAPACMPARDRCSTSRWPGPNLAFRRRDRGGVPDLHGDHGKRRHQCVYSIVTPRNLRGAGHRQSCVRAGQFTVQV